MSASQNHLIELLPRKDRLGLLALCEPFELVTSTVLCEPGEPTRHVYFPVEGFISLVNRVEGSPGLEVGMVGREGMLGAQVALGVMTVPLHALVQGQGMAWRIGVRPFAGQLAVSPALRGHLHRYLFVLMAQLASAAGCLRFHSIDARLARWLLLTHDRAGSDDLYVTHQFLAYMLGVRRVGITAAAGALQRDGLIAYRRGEVKVLDRAGLEAAACGCYAVDQRIYDDLLA